MDGNIYIPPTESTTHLLLQGNQECNNDLILPMDNPLLDNFTDLTSLIDSSILLSLSLEPELMESYADCSNNILDLESPSTIVTSSPFSTSPSTPDNVVPSSPFPLERKRKATSTSDTVEPVVTKKPSKYVERRKKNNVASQVSRAKRRTRNVDLFSREKELEEENAKLRIRAEEMSKEAARLKKLLIEQLAHRS